MSTLNCCIDSRPVPDERLRLKGIAAATCSKECYAEARSIKHESRRYYRVAPEEWALVLRLRRAKFTLADFPAFASWWRQYRKAKELENGTQGEVSSSVRHDLNASPGTVA